MPNDGSAVIAKWDRDKTKREDADERAHSSMKKVLAAALKSGDTRKNIRKQLKSAENGGNTLSAREGYGEDDEVITGYTGERPWERD